MLFADRVKSGIPGVPTGLTPFKSASAARLDPSQSAGRRTTILVRYIERLGTGTLDMIEQCRQADLPEPEFRQDGGQWVCTLWLDPLTETALLQIALNPRQRMPGMAPLSGETLDMVDKSGEVTEKRRPAERSPAPAPARPGWAALAAAGVTVVLWASAFVAIRSAGAAFSPAPWLWAGWPAGRSAGRGLLCAARGLAAAGPPGQAS